MPCISGRPISLLAAKHKSLTAGNSNVSTEDTQRERERESTVDDDDDGFNPSPSSKKKRVKPFAFLSTSLTKGRKVETDTGPRFCLASVGLPSSSFQKTNSKMKFMDFFYYIFPEINSKVGICSCNSTFLFFGG